MAFSSGETLRILLIGDSDAPEMRRVRESLKQLGPRAEIARAATVGEAAGRIISDDWFAELIVVCQRWPDEFTAADVRQLLAAAPLARWVVCGGAWCESDGRNCDVWPLGVRVPARMAAARIGREVDVLEGTRPALPLTASRDETFEFDAHLVRRAPLSEPPVLLPAIRLNGGGGERRECRTRTAHVISPDGAWRRLVSDLLGTCGWRAGAEPDAALVWIYDLDPWRAGLIETIRSVNAARPHLALIGAMGLIYPEDVEGLARAGMDCVVSKLGVCDELPTAIEALINIAANSSAPQLRIERVKAASDPPMFERRACGG